MGGGGAKVPPFFLLMIFITEERQVEVQFPTIMYLKIQVDWDKTDFSKLKFKRVENIEEYKALKDDYVFSFRDVTNSVKRKRKATTKKQKNIEV